MPIETCRHCLRMYHYTEEYGREDKSCFNCSSGGSPAAWIRDATREQKFNTLPYATGAFAHVAKRYAVHHTPTYSRVRIRRVYPEGTITTFCGKVFIEGECHVSGEFWTLQPLTQEVERKILREELIAEIDKLWSPLKREISLQQLSDILDVLRCKRN